MGKKMTPIAVNLKDVSTEPRWYTVVTKFNYEKKFASDLLAGLKNSGLENDILDVIVPFKETEEIVRNADGKEKKKIHVDKIYPLYVFVKAKMSEPVWDYIRTTNGAAMILAAGGCPLTMSDQDMMGIKDACGLLEKEKREEKLKNIEKIRSSFKGKINDSVIVNNDIFSNYSGKICGIDLTKNKVSIRLDINAINIECNIEDLQFTQ